MFDIMTEQSTRSEEAIGTKEEISHNYISVYLRTLDK